MAIWHEGIVGGGMTTAAGTSTTSEDLPQRYDAVVLASGAGLR